MWIGEISKVLPSLFHYKDNTILTARHSQAINLKINASVFLNPRF